MATQKTISKNDIEEVATRMGFKFEHIKIFNGSINHSNDDPDTVYLMDTGKQLKFGDSTDSTKQSGPYDAMLWTGKTAVTGLWYDHMTKATIRRLLQSTAVECIVCMEEVEERDYIFCARCHGEICTVCLAKIVLTEGAMARILTGCADGENNCPCCRYELKYECVKCRYTLIDECRLWSFKLMDRLDLFTEQQQRVLLFLKQSDPEFEEKLEHWNEWGTKISSWHFQPGSIVRLHGLKRKEWNGKKAVIIGKAQLKNNVFRWPIQLMVGNKDKALLRQRNLKKVKQIDTK